MQSLRLFIRYKIKLGSLASRLGRGSPNISGQVIGSSCLSEDENGQVQRFRYNYTDLIVYSVLHRKQKSGVFQLLSTNTDESKCQSLNFCSLLHFVSVGVEWHSSWTFMKPKIILDLVSLIFLTVYKKNDYKIWTQN